MVFGDRKSGAPLAVRICFFINQTEGDTLMAKDNIIALQSASADALQEVLRVGAQ